VTPIYLIQIPIETTCDPGTLLDIAIELGGQAAAEATECANSSLEATVDEQAILVRPAGPTSLERDLLAALEGIVAECGRSGGFGTWVHEGVSETMARIARDAINKAGGAK